MYKLLQIVGTISKATLRDTPKIHNYLVASSISLAVFASHPPHPIHYLTTVHFPFCKIVPDEAGWGGPGHPRSSDRRASLSLPQHIPNNDPANFVPQGVQVLDWCHASVARSWAQFRTRGESGQQFNESSYVSTTITLYVQMSCHLKWELFNWGPSLTWGEPIAPADKMTSLDAK